jgi:hypothetical protein
MKKEISETNGKLFKPIKITSRFMAFQSLALANIHQTVSLAKKISRPT